MRFIMSIAQDPISSVALSVFNVNSATAYLELDDQHLRIQEGNLFHTSFPLKDLGRAERTSWQWYMGIGLHADLMGTVAPITNTENLVVIPVTKPTDVFLPLLGILGLQVSCKKILVSLSEPDTFLTVFNQGKAASSSGPTVVTIE